MPVNLGFSIDQLEVKENKDNKNRLSPKSPQTLKQATLFAREFDTRKLTNVSPSPKIRTKHRNPEIIIDEPPSSPNRADSRKNGDQKFDTNKLTNVSPTPLPKSKPKIPAIVLNQYREDGEDIESNCDITEEEIRRKKKFKRTIAIVVLVLLFIMYFIAVIIVHSKIEEEDYWCNGDGLLIIMVATVSIFSLYFKFVKPVFGKKFYKKIMKPIGIKFNELSGRWYLHYILYAMYFGGILSYLVYDTSKERERLISVLGIFVILLFGFLFSTARKMIIWRHVAWGIGFQYALGFVILKWASGKAIFKCFAGKIQTYLEFTDKGSGFVFGELSSEMGIFAFKVLSVILFFSFCIQILYYYGAMQWLVIKMGWILQITIGTTACESVNAAANIFLGLSEAPLMIKPYLPYMTKSELHAIMAGGFATIAGTVMAAYISFGIDPVSLLSASVMNAPAALAFSKLFYPEQEISKTKSQDIKIEKGKEANVLHAAIEGVSAAIPLVANIAANLIAIVAFVAFIDAILNWSCSLVNLEDGACSLSSLFGYVLMPLAWVMGVPWEDCYMVAQLIGTKTTINEFVAYVKLVQYKEKNTLSKRTELIATYALCGFSNFSSIGSAIGGLGAMAPDRKGDLSKVVFRAMIAGNIACFLTACIAGSLMDTGGSLLEQQLLLNETLGNFNETAFIYNEFS